MQVVFQRDKLSRFAVGLSPQFEVLGLMYGLKAACEDLAMHNIRLSWDVGRGDDDVLCRKAIQEETKQPTLKQKC